MVMSLGHSRRILNTKLLRLSILGLWVVCVCSLFTCVGIVVDVLVIVESGLMVISMGHWCRIMNWRFVGVVVYARCLSV